MGDLITFKERICTQLLFRISVTIILLDIQEKYPLHLYQ